MRYRIVYNGGFSGARPFYSGERQVLQVKNDKILNNVILSSYSIQNCDTELHLRTLNVVSHSSVDLFTDQ